MKDVILNVSLMMLFLTTTTSLLSRSIIDVNSYHSADSLHPLVNTPLPAFSSILLHGDSIKSQNLIGKKVVINFWFSTCGPCMAEIPHLNKLKEDYKGLNVFFLSMTPDSDSVATKFIEKHKFSFPTLTNQEKYIHVFGDVFPKNIFVDTKGIIRVVEGSVGLDIERSMEDIFDKGIRVDTINFLETYMDPRPFYDIIDSLD